MQRILSILIFAVTLLSASVLAAAELRVPDGFKKIQEAVNAAKPGDTIVVERGDYTENVFITKPVTLKSQKGPSSTVIEPEEPNEPVVKITGVDGARVEGFTFKNSVASGLTLANVRNSTVINNRATSNANGIILVDSSSNTIKDNTADANEVYGIYLERSDKNTVEGNTANRNHDKGFFISSSNDNVIKDNNANLNTWNGITVWSGHNNTITGNVTLRNEFGLVVTESVDNELSDNTALPNLYIILPMILLYCGIIFYLLQKNVLRIVYRKG